MDGHRVHHKQQVYNRLVVWSRVYTMKKEATKAHTRLADSREQGAENRRGQGGRGLTSHR